MPSAEPAPTAVASTLAPRRRSSLPDRDVRAKRPPAALASCCAGRRCGALARVVSLLALDFAGVFAGDLHRAVPQGRRCAATSTPRRPGSRPRTSSPSPTWSPSLLFARSGLYAERAQRPGLTRIVASLFQVDARRADLRAGQRRGVLELLHLLRLAVLRRRLRLARCAASTSGVTGWLLRAAGYQRRAVLVGTGAAHRGGRARARRRPRTRRSASSASSRSTPRPDNGLRSLGTLDDLARRDRRAARRRGHHRRPRLPAAAGGRARRPLPPRGRRACGSRRRRWRSSSTAPSSSPASRVPLFELKPPVFEGIDFARQAHVRPRRRRRCCCSSSARCCSPIALAVQLTSRGPVLYRSWRPGIGGVPFACLKFRTMYRDADERQAELESLNEAVGRAVQDPRRPARDAGRAPPAPLLARRAAAAVNVLRGEMSLVGPRPLPQRDFEPPRGLAQEALPRAARASPACGRSPGARSSTSTTSCGSTSSTSSAGRSSSTSRSCVKTIPAVFSRRGAF